MCTHTHIYTYCTYAHIDMFKADIVLERQNPSPRVFSSSLHPSWDFSSCISRDSLWPTPLDSYGSRLGWTHPAQPVDNPYYPTPPLGGPTYILPPLSTLVTILLVSSPAFASLRSERTTICWPKSLASPLKSPSLLPPPCLLLSGRKQHLPHYLTSCCQNCFFFPSFSLF